MPDKQGKCHAVPGETTALSTELVIANVVIYQDAYGRYNLNSLHQASEEAENVNKSPGQWVRLKTTKKLVEAMDKRDAHLHVEVVHGGDRSGTYAHELLAVAYASWISPDFHLTVNQAFLDMKRGILSAVVPDPVEKYPELRALREMVVAIAEARDEAMLAREEAHAAEVRAARAETKADLALEDTKRMTIEQFVLKNGLLRQFPVSDWRRMATWLTDFCQAHALPIYKEPVPGRLWSDENSYPITIFGDYLRAHRHRLKQIPLVEEETVVYSTTDA